MGEIFSPPLTSLLNTHMNYLILTPDGVGSTLLQRLLTMTLYLESHAVKNTHELTNGIGLEDGVASKTSGFDYSQSLDEIASVLRSSDPKTQLVSRVAKYHIDARKDSMEDCGVFYKFLNTHFNHQIACFRKNIFEYAMSWSIRNKSGVLNVYGKDDRIKVSKVSEVDEDYFINKCSAYVKYVEWIEKNFPNVTRIAYEDIVKDSDMIIQKVTGYQNTFKNKFGLSLDTILLQEYELLKQHNKKELHKDQVKSLIKYKIMSKEMVQKKIITNVPLKNTTLTDKRKQIQNFDNCLEKFYKFARNHNWIDQSNATYDFWNNEYIC